MWCFQSLATVGLLLVVLLLQGKVLFYCYHLFPVQLQFQKMLRTGMLLSLGVNKELIRSGNCFQVFCHWFVLSSVIKKVRDFSVY